MSIITSAILAQKAMPVASEVMSSWVVSRSLMEEDFFPEENSSSASVIPLLYASVMAVVTVEPGTGRIMGSCWQLAVS